MRREKQWETWRKTSQCLRILIWGLCFWMPAMVNSCLFHSFCHAGLMQHFAGKYVFNSVCSNRHTNKIGKIKDMHRQVVRLLSSYCGHHFGLRTYASQTYFQLNKSNRPQLPLVSSQTVCPKSETEKLNGFLFCRSRVRNERNQVPRSQDYTALC